MIRFALLCSVVLVGCGYSPIQGPDDILDMGRDADILPPVRVGPPDTAGQMAYCDDRESGGYRAPAAGCPDTAHAFQGYLIAVQKQLGCSSMRYSYKLDSVARCMPVPRWEGW